MITQEIAAKALGPSWASVMWDEFNKPYVGPLQRAVASDRKDGEVFPSKENVFRALKETPYDKVKVVILGQDPYHTPGMANGLAFSVPEEIFYDKLPPSLQNILMEVESDVGFKEPAPSQDLTRWAHQGVLLLNRTLTVRAHSANSHSHLGWDLFTNRVLHELGYGEKPIVFMLWGNSAQEAKNQIDPFTKWIIQTSHPSPLSAYRGFFGSRCFSKCNEHLASEGLEEINW